MRPVTEPVTLSPQEINSLFKELGDTRHDVNNALSLISAATELIRMNPELIPKLMGTLNDQPARIASCLQQFSGLLEQNLTGNGRH